MNAGFHSFLGVISVIFTTPLTGGRTGWKPYIEEQCFGDEAKLKEFAYDRLKRELDTGSGQPEDATNEANGQPEDGAGNASA